MGEGAGDGIAALITLVARMAPHIGPCYGLPGLLSGGLVDLVQDLPQVLVKNGLLGCGLPAATLPTGDPLGDAFFGVFAIGE